MHSFLLPPMTDPGTELFDQFARQAVERLRSHGLTAHRMEEGVAEWEERGHPVATGEPDTA